MPNLRFFAKFGMNSFVNNDMQNPSLRELFERIRPSLRDYCIFAAVLNDIHLKEQDIETGHGIIIPLWYFEMNY